MDWWWGFLLLVYFFEAALTFSWLLVIISALQSEGPLMRVKHADSSVICGDYAFGLTGKEMIIFNGKFLCIKFPLWGGVTREGRREIPGSNWCMGGKIHTLISSVRKAGWRRLVFLRPNFVFGSINVDAIYSSVFVYKDIFFIFGLEFEGH